jgi:hypothetical protein
VAQLANDFPLALADRLLADFQVSRDLAFGSLVPEQLPDEPLIGERKFQHGALQ